MKGKIPQQAAVSFFSSVTWKQVEPQVEIKYRKIRDTKKEHKRKSSSMFLIFPKGSVWKL